MVFSILKWTCISLTLIFLVHHLYMFLLNTLTVPKITDLVNKPTEQYREMQASTANGHANGHASANGNANGTNVDPQTTMAVELSAFLQDLKQNVPHTSNKSTNDFLSANDTSYTPF